MNYKLRYSPQARVDLDAVEDDVFEASGSYAIAEKYVDDFREKISRKKQFPESGIPLLYNGLFTGFFFVHFKAYNAFYRVRGEYMEVVRILMAKTDYMRVLFPENEGEEL